MNNMTEISNLVIGIADQKKAGLDLLNEQVKQAQYEVTQQQVIVNSLTAKSSQFNAYLAQADIDQTTALANLKQVKELTSSVNALVDSTLIAQKQADDAKSGIVGVSLRMADLINKLIFSVEIIDKLTQMINKQKSINPLVPDSLVTFLSKAMADANNAVALTLTAMQSCYAAEATMLDANGCAVLSNAQVTKLQARIEQGWNARKECPATSVCQCGYTDDSDGILSLLHRAYTNATANYEQALWDNNSVTKQMLYGQEQLAAAITRLNSYKAGLAAATAAAYAA